jgi:hypothetical protein
MGTKLKQLTDAWIAREFIPGHRNVLEADEAVIRGMKAESAVVYRDWRTYTEAHCFARSDGKEFHLGLMPMPYLGNLREARVFLLSLNPGIGAHDYFGEHQVKEYAMELRRNLRQEEDARFPFLLPAHSWHGGAAYWSPRLRGILNAVSEISKLSLADATAHCARRIAVLELVPYHSTTFEMTAAQVNKLESARLARAFVFGELLPRQSRGECKVIVLRARQHWLPAGIAEREAAASQLPPARMPRNAYIAAEDVRLAAKLICGHSDSR